MRGWKFWIGLLVGLTALAYFSKDLEAAEFARAWGKIDYAWYSAGMVVFCFSFWLRCPRWKTLIGSLGQVSLGVLTKAFFVGMLANRLFPARLGEVVRCYMLRRHSGLPFVGLLATVAVEKAFDGLALLTVFFLALSSIPADQVPEDFAGILVQYRSRLYLGALGFPALLLAAAWISPWLAKGVRKTLGPSSQSRVVRILESILLALSVLRRGGHLVSATAWTVGAWTLLVLSEYCTLRSFGWDLPPAAAVVLCASIGIAVSVPQAPSFVGVFQLAVQWVLIGLYEVPLQEAKAFAVAIWITQILPVGLIGFVCLRLLGSSLAEVTRVESPDSGAEPG